MNSDQLSELGMLRKPGEKKQRMQRVSVLPQWKPSVPMREDSYFCTKKGTMRLHLSPFFLRSHTSWGKRREEVQREEVHSSNQL